MLPLLTAATARELLAALPQGTQITLAADSSLAAERALGTTATACCEQPQEHCIYALLLAGKPWLACITGVGPINAALAMGLAFARFPAITAVLNVGLAGSFDLTRAPLGSTIAVTQEIWPEYGLADDAGVDAAGLGFPLWAKEGIIDRLPLSADPLPMGLPPLPPLPPLAPLAPLERCPMGPLVAGYSVETAPLDAVTSGWAGGATTKGTSAHPSDAVNSGTAATAHAIPQGTSLTVAGVTNSPERAQRLQGRYAALLENMEGFAVALACARHKVPLLELRTVSNVTGSRLVQDRNFPLAFRNMHLFFTTYFTHTQ